MQENLWGPAPGNLTMTEKRGGASTNQHVDLGRLSLYLQSPSSNTNQWFGSSAEPSQEHTLTKELGGVQICLIQILK